MEYWVETGKPEAFQTVSVSAWGRTEEAGNHSKTTAMNRDTNFGHSANEDHDLGDEWDRDVDAFAKC